MKVIVVLLMLSFASAAENAYNIVPRPAVLTPLQGHFAFTKATTIVVPQIVDKQLSQLVFLAAKAITEMFEKSAGFNYNPIELRDPVLDEAVDVVAFDLTPDIANPEGYEMRLNAWEQLDKFNNTNQIKNLEIEYWQKHGEKCSAQFIRKFAEIDAG
ncbi:MAG: hypothetical protein EZS28_029039 [Streblomastix strix]|uniref:Beta-hexosaminidase bacterial type N-terminal domain-containing protein n=1 Tax=Streblomastix strix TaxID=222440 RepID=A0A5J4V073_9EUKA|nr:MAG: hypothetical protein EZS28_029039 [Streblomastix strix]